MAPCPVDRADNQWDHVRGGDRGRAVCAFGIAALMANMTCALLLWRHREGDANRRSVWICSRNDAIGNLAVVAAAVGVFGTGTGWPDLAVAAVLSGLGLWGGSQIIRHTRQEMQGDRLAA